ncbi:hypothetical protein UMZ34_19995 [Halopseudomonas pachastrellae]|nr:hypothetical protein UMZ34_19995 [Halopseudomonas pachastrellae]
MIKQLVSKLRDAIQFHVQAYLDQHAKCLAQLQADSHWQQLTDEQQRAILDKRKLLTLEQPTLNDAEAISTASARSAWSSGPTAPTPSPASSTAPAWKPPSCCSPSCNASACAQNLESEADIDAWLAEVKQQILSKLNDGPVTF